MLEVFLQLMLLDSSFSFGFGFGLGILFSVLIRFYVQI